MRQPDLDQKWRPDSGRDLEELQKLKALKMMQAHLTNVGNVDDRGSVLQKELHCLQLLSRQL